MESTSSPYLKHLYVCVNQRDPGKTCCAAGGLSGAASASGSHAHGGAEAIREKLKAFVKANGLQGKVRVSSSGCMDLCAQGPNVMVYPDYRWYHHVTLEDGDQIIQEHLAPLVPKEPVAESNKPAIEAFLFDLGNVLVRFDHTVLARAVTHQTKMGPEDLFRLFYDSPLVADHDRGRISSRVFFEGLKGQVGLSMSYEEFLVLWNGIFSEVQEMTALVKRLLPQYPCYLISNTNRAHFEFCLKEYPILHELTGWILSYEVGVLKPHTAIYQRAVDLTRVPPQRIFYVDDRSDLIAAADRIGFQTHRFSGDVKPLISDLKQRGVDHL